jgi:hypothetical protein
MRLSEFLRDVGRAIAYLPGLAKCLGGVKAAILFCQLFYWSQRAANEWFFKSLAELAAETGMTFEELRAARKELAERRVVETRYKRIEHRLYFRVDYKRLNEVWDAYVTQDGQVGNSHMPRGKMPDGEAVKYDFDRSDHLQTTPEIGYRAELNGPHLSVSNNPKLEPNVTPEELFEGWNEHCVKLGLLRVSELSKKRRENALAKIREHPAVSWWNQVLGKVANSHMLKGQCKPAHSYDKSFKADFDWLLKDDNALKVYEGKYDG